MKGNQMQIKRPGLILLLGMVMLLSLKSAGQSTFVVTTTSDPISGGLSSVGQLRWAIEQANLATGTSIITFNISGTGPFTITPNATFPVIVKTVIIDGTTQPGYDFNDPATPMIIIDGTISSPLSQGIAFNNAPGSKMTGIYIKRFQNGLSITLSNSCEITNNVINRINTKSVALTQSSFCVFKGNYINTDKTLLSLSPASGEGIIISQSNDNIIGGTNCGDGNIIAYVTSEGIDNYPVTGQRNLITGNTIFGCSLNEIFLRTSGNGGKTYPTIVTTGCTTSGTSQANDVIQIFGSTGGLGARLNAKVYMGTTTANSSGNWSIPLSDIRYPYLVATATNSTNNTSELCPAKAVTKDTLKLSIYKPSPICVGEKVKFENPTSKCLGTLNFEWDFGDGTSPTTSSSHTYTAVGTYTVTLSVPEANNCPAKSTTSVISVTKCGAFDCDTIPPPCNLAATITGPVVSGTEWLFTANPTGGTPGYTYLWFDASANLLPITSSTSATVHTAKPLAGAPYSIKVTVTDSKGCSVTIVRNFAGS